MIVRLRVDLPQPELADQPEDFTLAHRQRNAVDRLDHALALAGEHIAAQVEMGVHVVEDEQILARIAGGRAHRPVSNSAGSGSSTTASAFASTLSIGALLSQ